MRLDRRHPCLHECEARTSDDNSTTEKFDVAEKRDVAGRDACVPVASAVCFDQEANPAKRLVTSFKAETTTSTSSSVLNLPSENRIDPIAFE